MTHINQRRDSASNWTAANPVLHLGEVGWEVDTKKAKLGDGTTAWIDLDYIVRGEVLSVNGETGTVVLDKTDIGLGAVDNTPDTNKPVSVFQQLAFDSMQFDIDEKAPLDSPALTGTPTAPTPTAGDDDTSIATTEFVQGELSGVVRRKGSTTVTSTTTAADGVVVVAASFTIPNPINGRIYRVTANGRFFSDTAGGGTALNLIHGLGITTTGTAITGSGTGVAVDHRVASRTSTVTLVGEFTYSGTDGEADYRAVLTFAGVGGVSTRNASATGPLLLLVDEIA